MGLLENFRDEKIENKPSQEMELETYVKMIVENTIQGLNKELNTTLSVSKNKIAELTLELSTIQELKKEMARYGENFRVISEKMLKNSEIFSKEFIKKLDEVKSTNEIFEETLKKSQLQENLERSFRNYLSSYAKISEETLNKISNKAYNAILEQEKRLKMRDYILIFINIIFAIVLIFGFFSYRNIQKENRKTQGEIQIIKEILAEDRKYWFSQEDKKAYISHVEDIEKRK
ncbi:MAG: hypothetical protein HUJ88_13585 [Fusobacterium necrophorum]|nr:hypothetical protein [Fusobacterium necrophorum]